MGHRERVTAAAEALAAWQDQRATLVQARNQAIKEASADEVPDKSISRWCGVSPTQVRRIINE